VWCASTVRCYNATVTPEAQAEPASAFISWAHAHDCITAKEWQDLVWTFASKLREWGVVSDIDLAHLHDQDVDWSTFGVSGILGSDYVLLVASSAYKERWEGQGDQRKGAGAAREANTLKALFDDDRKGFQRKVKVILLPGVTTDAIPTELRSSPQRFHIKELTEEGMADLLRTLHGRPEFVLPALGKIPELPPKPPVAEHEQQAADAAPEEPVDTAKLDELKEWATHGPGADEDEEPEQAESKESAPEEDDSEATHLEKVRLAITDAHDAVRGLPGVVREALFQQFHDYGPLIIDPWNSDSRFSPDDARSAAEDGYLDQEDEERLAYTPRTANRRVSRAEDALRGLRGLLADSPFGGDEMAEWIIDAIEKDYDGIEDTRFGVRSTWQAFGLL
jgi:hypothetical protein